MPAPVVALKSGFVALKNGVASYFAANGISASVSLGWSARTRQDNQGAGQANRVVFMVGDKNGKAGRIVQPEQPGDRAIVDANGATVAYVRALRTWERIILVSVWACDTSNPTDEDLQVEATDKLLEQTIQAVHYATNPDGTRAIGAANIEWGDVETSLTPVDRSFGRELLATMTYRHPIFGPIQEVAFPGYQVNRDMNPSP